MKTFLALLILVSSSQAQAIHAYATSSCKNSSKKIGLAYDGPGSNYAFGGYYNFYVGNQKEGILANDESVYQENVGDVVGDNQLQVTFINTDYKKVGKERTDKVVCSDGEAYAFEHSEWKSIQTVKIKEISRKASKKLKMKAGDSIELLCEETSDVPVDCK